MPHILSVSYNPALLNTRHLLFESRGYEVTSVEGFIAALKKCRESTYALLVIGHSIPHADKAALIVAVGMHRRAPILSLLRPHEPPVEGATESVDASKPDLILDAVERLLAKSTKTLSL